MHLPELMSCPYQASVQRMFLSCLYKTLVILLAVSVSDSFPLLVLILPGALVGVARFARAD